MRQFIALVVFTLLFAGCGGGGSDVNTGGGGGGGGGTATIATAGSPNVEPVLVDGGPSSLSVPDVNTAFVSVKICVPGSTAQCQIIDHVEVDTGSIGLRILSSVLTVPLTAELDVNNNPLAECLTFADNTVSWGTIAVADVVMPTSGETASNVNVHVIGSTAAGTIPATCLGTNTEDDTVATFGANGIIGIGAFATDCNDGPCAPGQAATYYTCPSATTCATVTATQQQQLQNPVTLFATDNNGSILEMPAIADTGAISPSGGVLVFGIGTRSNNALGSATQLPADPDSGVITAQFQGTNYTTSYFDSGSNAYFVENSGAATCTNGEFLCPTSTLSESATLIGTNNATAPISFSIANADSLFNNNPMATAYNNLGAVGFDSATLDVGMPFFFGENVYLGIENATTETAPYYAFIAN